MFKKKLSVLLAAVMLSSFLYGCGSGSADNANAGNENAGKEETINEENSGSGMVKSEEEFTLTYASTSLGVTGNGSVTDENAKNAIAFYEEKFKELYPNATLELVNIPGNNYADLFMAKYSSDTLEDVIHMNVPNYKQYMKAGLLQDLSDQPWVKDILPIAKETCTYQGKWYTTAESITVYGVFYNKAIFDELGLTAPGTWEELIEVCEALKTAGITPFVGGFKDNWLLQMAFEKGAVAPFLQNTYPDPTLDIYYGDLTWDGPEMKGALDRFTELVRNDYFNKDCLSIGWDQSREVLRSGQAAMMLSASFLPGMISTEEDPMDLGFFATPNDDGTQPIVAAAAQQWGVNANSKHIEAAIDLVNIMASKEGIEIVNNNAKLSAFANTDVNQNIPVMTEIAEVLKTSKLVNNLSYTAPSAGNKLFQEILTSMVAGKEIEETDMADVQALQEQDKASIVVPED